MMQYRSLHGLRALGRERERENERERERETCGIDTSKCFHVWWKTTPTLDSVFLHFICHKPGTCYQLKRFGAFRKWSDSKETVHVHSFSVIMMWSCGFVYGLIQHKFVCHWNWMDLKVLARATNMFLHKITWWGSNVWVIQVWPVFGPVDFFWGYHLSLACLYRFPNKKWASQKNNALLQSPVFINSVARRFLKLIASQKGPMNGRVKSFDVVFYHEGIESMRYLCLHPKVISRLWIVVILLG